jgi:hypothetical protein
LTLTFTSSCSIADGLCLQIGNQQKIDDIPCIVGLIDDDRPSARCRSHIFATTDGDLSPVGEMDHKRLERLGVVEVAYLLDRHGNLVGQSWGKPPRQSTQRRRARQLPNVGYVATTVMLKLWGRDVLWPPVAPELFRSTNVIVAVPVWPGAGV